VPPGICLVGEGTALVFTVSKQTIPEPIYPPDPPVAAPVVAPLMRCRAIPAGEGRV